VHPEPHPHYFYANLDELWDPYYQKVGVVVRTPSQNARGSASDKVSSRLSV